VVVEGGLSEDQVHDAIRLAATIQASAVSLEIAEVPAAAPLEAATQG
jgi:alkyl hydroperoxide reductase subunit D